MQESGQEAAQCATGIVSGRQPQLIPDAPTASLAKGRSPCIGIHGSISMPMRGARWFTQHQADDSPQAGLCSRRIHMTGCQSCHCPWRGRRPRRRKQVRCRTCTQCQHNHRMVKETVSMRFPLLVPPQPPLCLPYVARPSVQPCALP
jgi:hypothetical protein